jgi:hypothetical protein
MDDEILAVFERFEVVWPLRCRRPDQRADFGVDLMRAN